MFKRFLLLLILVFTATALTGCKYKDTIILFNHNPITKETILNNSVNFKPGEKIYYIFITKKPLTSKIIRVQVIKKDDKTEFWGTSVVYSNDFKLYKDQVYYYNDYIYIREKGHYYLFVFSKDNPNKYLGFGDFYVSD